MLLEVASFTELFVLLWGGGAIARLVVTEHRDPTKLPRAIQRWWRRPR